MRFPASVNISTYQAYRNLDSVEVDRVLKAENFEWDSEHPKSLATLCVERISTNWAGIPKLEELVPKDREYFLQILDTNVPLQLLVDNIKNDLFWERCYQSKWSELPESVRNKKWINIFVEKYYVDILENMIPREYDPEKVRSLVKICGPYIQSLNIRSLVPTDTTVERIISPEMAELITSRRPSGNKLSHSNKIQTIPRDHISLHAAIGSLPNLVELQITYQMRSVGIQYQRNQFQFTNNDAKNLALGLEKCLHLKALMITRTDMNCQRLSIILRGISVNLQIETLDFSHCRIGDDGANAIAKFMARHDKLKNLILNHSSCCLRNLDLRLNNNLGSEGIAHIAVAIARGCNLISLNISGCGITPLPLQKPPAGVWSAINALKPPTCGDLLARAIGLVKTPLRSLDISVNNIGSPSDSTLSNAICLSYLIDINLIRSGMGSLSMAVAESAAAAQRLRRESEKGVRFRRSADADPVLLAQQLSARPSIVSVTSEEGTYNVLTRPLPSDFGFIPAIKGILRERRRKSDGSIQAIGNEFRTIRIFISNPNDTDFIS
ncbi:unnamed protein product [Leptidea sinapis]|uniref:Uncharacterized protein n=1 Tax=Leptidea sinapis TaxID=189913 RepID=A0A5E4PX20_9NEOP|nr:unnamed protein product [Leptidea sinapis]